MYGGGQGNFNGPDVLPPDSNTILSESGSGADYRGPTPTALGPPEVNVLTLELRPD